MSSMTKSLGQSLFDTVVGPREPAPPPQARVASDAKVNAIHSKLTLMGSPLGLLGVSSATVRERRRRILSSRSAPNRSDFRQRPRNPGGVGVTYGVRCAARKRAPCGGLEQELEGRLE